MSLSEASTAVPDFAGESSVALAKEEAMSDRRSRTSGDAAARQQMEPGSPFETLVVPSIGSSARSNLWLPGFQVPGGFPLKMHGASPLTPFRYTPFTHQ